MEYNANRATFNNTNDKGWYRWVMTKFIFLWEISKTFFICFGIVGGLWLIYQMLINPSYAQQMMKHLGKIGMFRRAGGPKYAEGCSNEQEAIGIEKEEVIGDYGTNLVDLNESTYREL